MYSKACKTHWIYFGHDDYIFQYNFIIALIQFAKWFTAKRNKIFMRANNDYFYIKLNTKLHRQSLSYHFLHILLLYRKKMFARNIIPINQDRRHISSPWISISQEDNWQIKLSNWLVIWHIIIRIWRSIFNLVCYFWYQSAHGFFNEMWVNHESYHILIQFITVEKNSRFSSDLLYIGDKIEIEIVVKSIIKHCVRLSDWWGIEIILSFV